MTNTMKKNSGTNQMSNSLEEKQKKEFGTKRNGKLFFKCI